MLIARTSSMPRARAAPRYTAPPAPIARTSARAEALVTGTKSMTGHLLGGAGAIESIFTILALRDRTAPPTINLENIDPEIHIPVAANSPHELPSGDIAALNNSFGFGGHDVALVFRSA